MVKQLFELSKMESAEFEPRKEPFVFSDLLQENINAYAVSFSEKNITVECDGCRNPAWLVADVSMMERVIQNLLVNALKYTPNNGSLRVGLTTSDAEIVVRIQNSGKPVNRDIQQWINAGSSEVAIRNKPPQTGFGLLIIKKIVQLHCFAFNVSGAAEEGNCFELKMPLHLFGLSKN